MHSKDIRRILNEINLINEVFDSSLKLIYNKELSDIIKKDPKISSSTAYQSQIKDNQIVFIEFLYKNAWEVHFLDDNDTMSLNLTKKFKKNEVSKIIATAIELLEKRLIKGNKIRFYSDNTELNLFYQNILKYLLKRHPKLQHKTVNNFLTPQNNTVEAIECWYNFGTFKVNYVE